MYAVIKTGGKQYRVQPGDTIVVEKLDGDAGAELFAELAKRAIREPRHRGNAEGGKSRR